jgi:RNA polymerase sigma-B factor
MAQANRTRVVQLAIADERLLRRWRAGDERAREQLIERYLPLARVLALRYQRSAEPLDDLMQVAALGLVKAVDRWDPGRGFAFRTFALPTILGELRRHFRDTTWQVRPPRGLQELSRAVERLRDEHLKTGRAPTVGELAERLGRPPEDVDAALRASQARWPHSLQAAIVDDEERAATLFDTIGRDDPAFERIEARATIEHLTSRLEPRTREILRLRYDEDMHQREIAARVGCSQMHVSRLIRSALDELSVVAPAA